MVETWIANISPLYEDTCYQVLYGRAPEFRRKKADQLHVLQGKAQSIGVWSLYEQMKKEYGISEDAAYNFSHSGDYVLCSVMTGPQTGLVRVGCDIEKIGRYSLAVARRFFCNSEYERILEVQDEEERRTLFYRYWVLKESFVKATRRGLELGLDTFEIQHGNPSVLVRQPEEFSERYYYREFETKERDYRIAVCSTDCKMDSMIQMELKI